MSNKIPEDIEQQEETIKRAFRILTEGESKIIKIGPEITDQNIDPKRILAMAYGADLKDVIVIGYDPNDNYYFSSSVADGGEILWLLERLRHLLMTTSVKMESDED